MTDTRGETESTETEREGIGHVKLRHEGGRKIFKPQFMSTCSTIHVYMLYIHVHVYVQHVHSSWR